jgi:hypothetical protein
VIAATHGAGQSGIHVHWARDGAEHNQTVHGILRDRGAKLLIKSKSLRILIVEIAQENPKLPPPAGRGAPQKNLAMQVARTVAEHFYGLTGTRPTRITPTGGGKAHGPFLEFLATTYTILGIKASAENQAKAAINFVMKKYPKT